MSSTKIQPPYYKRKIEITLDADWHDPMHIIKNPDGSVVSLVGATLQMYIRPEYSFSPHLMVLSSAGADGIEIIDAAAGLWEVDVSREDVIEHIPAGTWVQYVVLTKSGYRHEIWRGELVAHPALV